MVSWSGELWRLMVVYRWPAGSAQKHRLALLALALPVVTEEYRVHLLMTYPSLRGHIILFGLSGTGS